MMTLLMLFIKEGQKGQVLVLVVFSVFSAIV